MENKISNFFNKLIENKKYKIMFFLCIILICIIALSVGIYVQFFYKYAEVDPLMMGIHYGENKDTQNINKLKTEFNDMFQNKLIFGINYKKENINKKQSNKEFVYNGYNLKEDDVNFYQIDVNIPILNIDSEEAIKINELIKSEFYDTANSIKRKMDGHTVYVVSYASYFYDDIISIVIKSSLKEKNKNEKVTITTYNYNVEKDSTVSLNNLIEKTENLENKVQNKIYEEIKRYNKNALAVAEEYGSTYTRDLESDIYKIENTKQYFITDAGKLYIIYPYGNDEYTNEIDIVIF